MEILVLVGFVADKGEIQKLRVQQKNIVNLNSTY